MKPTSKIFATAITVMMIFSAVIYSSCHKDPCSGVNCQNGGACSQGNCICPTGFTGGHCQYSTITYFNNTFTPVYITINGSSTTIQPGESVFYYGTPGDNAVGTATTYGQTNSGTQIGDAINFTFNDVFSYNGGLEDDINISSDYFYLKINNASSFNIGQEYVNFGTNAHTYDQVSIPNDGNTYGMGYYLAYNNTELRLLTSGGGHVWDYVINIPFQQNASYTFFAN